jgi:hypothetical protein
MQPSLCPSLSDRPKKVFYSQHRGLPSVVKSHDASKRALPLDPHEYGRTRSALAGRPPASAVVRDVRHDDICVFGDLTP